MHGYDIKPNREQISPRDQHESSKSRTLWLRTLCTVHYLVGFALGFGYSLVLGSVLNASDKRFGLIRTVTNRLQGVVWSVKFVEFRFGHHKARRQHEGDPIILVNRH